VFLYPDIRRSFYDITVPTERGIDEPERKNVDVLTNTKQVVTLRKNINTSRVFYLSDRDPTSNGSIVEQFALASTASIVAARVADDPLRPRGEICIATPSTSILLSVTTEPSGPGMMLQTVTIPTQAPGVLRASITWQDRHSQSYTVSSTSDTVVSRNIPATTAVTQLIAYLEIAVPSAVVDTFSRYDYTVGGSTLMVIADDRKKRVVHCIGKANIDGIITIAEDIGVLAPEGVETLLVGSSFLISPVPESGVDIVYAVAKANRVYSITIVAKPRILIEGRISHDDIPLDAPGITFGAPELPQTLPAEFKSMVAGNEGGDASNVVVSLPPSASWSYLTSDDVTSFSRLASYPGGVVRAFEAGVSMDVGWHSALAVAEFDPIISTSLQTGSTLFSVWPPTHTRLIKQNSVLFDLDDGAGFIVHAIDKGVRHPVHDTYSINLVGIEGVPERTVVFQISKDEVSRFV
jgi:hypothetical protein